MKDYRNLIKNEMSTLSGLGLSLSAEDSTSMTFADRYVSLTFSVEPNSDSLNAFVKFFSDKHEDYEVYVLNIIMEIVAKISPDYFKVDSELDHKKNVRNYVQFFKDHKEEMFGEFFPLADEYKKYIEKKSAEIKEMFEGHFNKQ